MNLQKYNKAVVILAKCPSNHKTYGIRAECLGPNNWELNWAFPIQESSAQREGYDNSTIQGTINNSDDYPGCPYCHCKHLLACGCGHISCSIANRGIVTCQWCGCSGIAEAYLGQSISAGTNM